MHELSDKDAGMCLCGTLNHSVSLKMPVSLSSGQEKKKKEKKLHCDDQMVKIIEFFFFVRK